MEPDVVGGIPELAVAGGAREPFELDFAKRQLGHIRCYLRGDPYLPYEVEIQPSSICNARCEFCWGENARLENLLSKAEHLDRVTDLIIGASAAIEHGVRSVKLVGSTGDPLCNEHLSPAIGKFVSAGIGVRVFTNGIGLPAYIDDLLFADYVRLSLDAGRPGTWAKIKGLSASRGEEKFRLALESFSQLATKRKNGKPKLHSSFVVCEHNWSEVEQAARLMAEAGADGIQIRKDFKLTRDLDEAAVRSQIDNALRLSSASGFQVTVVDDEEQLCGAGKCYYPRFWATVAANGRLYPCGHLALRGETGSASLLEIGATMESAFISQVEAWKRSKPPYHGACKFCPPVGLHASRLLCYLDELPATSREAAINRLARMAG